METRAHHILIGLFTVIIAGGLLWFGLWLAKGGFERDADYYDVVFSEEVTGLSVGSGVLYNGIRVGEVIRLELDPVDPRRVVARVRVGRNTPVKQDTDVQLGVAGLLTGAAHVRLSGGSPENPPLIVDDDHVPMIIARPSPIARLRAESDELLNGINSLVQKGNELLSPDNVERFSRTLDHIEKTTGVIAEQHDQIRQGAQALVKAGQQADETLKQAVVTMQEATDTVQQGTRLLGSANELIDAHGEDIFVHASRSMASLDRAMTSIDTLMIENHDILDDAMQSMNDIGPALHELRMILNSLRTVTRRLEEDPAGFLLSRDTIKEFNP